jgi:hypothetical protein
MRFNLILFLVAASSVFSCTLEPSILKPDVKKLLQKSLVNRWFKWRVGLNGHTSHQYYVLYKDGNKDFVTIEGNHYSIDRTFSNIDSSKLLEVQLDSIAPSERLLRVEYIYFPSMTTKIISEFRFKYENATWALTDSAATIADGHFKFPRLK